MKVSFGGKLIHNLLSGGKCLLVNNSEKCVGGPFTRVDPADTCRLSCLDLVLISIDLYAFIDILRVDKERVMTPHRAIGKQKKLVYTDHRSLLLIFKNLPINLNKKNPNEKISVWNTNKPNGWEMYKQLTDENEDLENLAIQQNLDSTEFTLKMDRILDKIKFRSFGKVTFTNKPQSDKSLEKLYKEKQKLISDNDNEGIITEVENKIASLLVEKQRTEYEKKLKDLKTLKESKGRCAASFNLKAKILGEKKVQQEATVVEDPETGEIVFEPNEIKTVSINYLKNLLNNREPKEDFVKDLAVIKILHERRMNEPDVKNKDDLTQKDFNSLLENLEKKTKSKYKFILKAGLSLHRCLFTLFKITWKSEVKPNQWEKTIAHQLYKGKGEKSKLSNHRFIHTKDEIPKSFEHILITKAKPNIISGCSKFPIGAIPKNQS